MKGHFFEVAFLFVNFIFKIVCTIRNFIIHLSYQDLKTKTNNKMENLNKITSRKELAIKLSKGPVQSNLISGKLDRIVKLWLKRNEIKLINGSLNLC